MHNLTIKLNGKAEMAYVGEKPWHSLGQDLKPGASIETWLEAAGMNWEVSRSPITFGGLDAKGKSWQQSWDENHALYRSDTHSPLGLVSKDYKAVHPKQVLEFFRDLAASNHCTLETAGTLKGGRVYWALAKINDAEGDVGKGDRMKGYVLLSSSADGSRKTRGKKTTVRVVCWNTLSMADGGKGEGCEVNVSHRSVFDEKQAKIDLGLAEDSFSTFMTQAKALAKIKLSPTEAANFTLQLLGGKLPAELTKEETTEILATKHAQCIAALYSGQGKGSQLATSKGTAWGLVNAVTEFVDHAYPSRSIENRLHRAWFGNSERLKNDALNIAMAMAA